MKVLVACEYSGTVRDAFIAKGHDAMSCDLLPTDVPGPHYEGDVFDLDLESFDLIVAHPPCTHLAVSGAAWFEEKRKDGRQQEGIDLFMRFAELAEMFSPVKRIAIENPICIMSSLWRKPTQIIQPWMFGHGETKATCFWLKNLPPLEPTNIVEGREQRIHMLPPGPDRWKIRSQTFQGIADAMAEQWGAL